MRLSEAIEQLKYYQSKPYVPTVKKVCNIALETIEALQQENEQLQAQVARMRDALTVANNYMPDIGQFCACGKCKTCGADINYAGYEHCVKCARVIIDEALSDTPADYHNPADVEVLRKARTAINNILYTVDYYIAESEIVPNEMHKRHINEAKEALAEIDKTLGGGQE